MYKKDLNEFEVNPFKMFTNAPILVAGDKENYNGLTIGWGGLGVLWGKKVGYIFVRKSRYTKAFMDKYERFTLSFLDDEHKNAINIFGEYSGIDTDKFKMANVHPSLDIDSNLIYIAESTRVLKFKKLYSVEITKDGFNDQELYKKFYPTDDTHVMYVGEITQLLEDTYD